MQTNKSRMKIILHVQLQNQLTIGVSDHVYVAQGSLRTEFGHDRCHIVPFVRVGRAGEVIPAAEVGVFWAGIPTPFAVGVDADELSRVDTGRAGEPIVGPTRAVQEEYDGTEGFPAIDTCRGDIELDLAFRTAVDAIGTNGLCQRLRIFRRVRHQCRCQHGRKGGDDATC